MASLDRRFIIAGFTFAILVIWTSVAESEERRIEASVLLDRAKVAIATWSRRTVTLIDPRLIYEIAGAMDQFAIVYGSDKHLRQLVDSLLGNQRQINQVVAEFLNEISNTREVRSVYARLASTIGSTARASGWQETQFNRYGRVRLPIGSSPAVLVAPRNQGGKQIGGESLLLGFGTHLVQVGRSNLAVSVIPTKEGRVVKTIRLGDLPTDKAVGGYHVQPDLKWFCSDPTAALSMRLDTLDPSCSKPDKNDPPPETSPFYKAASLSIRIEDPGHVCTIECQQALNAAMVQAIAQWRSGCGLCSSASLKVVRVGNSIWLDDEVVDAMSYAIVTGREPSQNQPDFAGLRLGRMFFRPGGTQPASGYHRVDGTPFGKALCDAGLERHVGEVLTAQLCNKQVPVCQAPKCQNFAIIMGQQTNGCALLGRSRFACARADKHIAFNTDVFRFEIPFGSGTPITFGQGKRPANAWTFLYHEIGHWFRLPHRKANARSQNGRWDIMAASPQPQRDMCITTSSLLQVDRAVNASWCKRLNLDDGFVAPPDWE